MSCQCPTDPLLNVESVEQLEERVRLSVLRLANTVPEPPPSRCARSVRRAPAREGSGEYGVLLWLGNRLALCPHRLGCWESWLPPPQPLPPRSAPQRLLSLALQRPPPPPSPPASPPPPPPSPPASPRRRRLPRCPLLRRLFRLLGSCRRPRQSPCVSLVVYYDYTLVYG